MKNNKNILRKKEKIFLIVIMIIIVFIFFWFSDILPKKAAEVVAVNYMLQYGDNYEVSGTEYSSAHDCYFVYFKDNNSSEIRNIGIYYRYFPFEVFFDSKYPG